MAMMPGRKGIVFTIVAIFFIILTISTYLVLNRSGEMEKPLSVESRVFAINNFVHDVERDMERALYISGFRAMLGLTEYMTLNATYIVNLSENFQELVLNGSINGQVMQSTNDSYLLLWMAKIDNEAGQIGLTVGGSGYSVGVWQQSPWWLDLELNLTLSVEDISGLAAWHKQERIRTQVPVEGLEDPLYIIGSDGVYTNVIIRSPYSFFVNQTNNNISNLNSHTINSYYIESASAPGYLMRLQGQLAPSANGIESLVYSLALVPLGKYENKSAVDYIYWSSSNPQHYGVSGMPNWFRLDNQSSHLAVYEVGGLVTG